MQDGALAGARFDGPIDTTTDRKTGSIGLPALSANDAGTAANELRTQLIITGSAVDDNEGMFSLGTLLGGGPASDEGSRWVADAADTIGKARSDVAALAFAGDHADGTEAASSDTQWNKVKAALDTVFNTDSDAGEGATSAVRASTPRQGDILDDIDDILDALASEDAFVAATADGGGGVFASQELGAGAATDAFNRVTWSATATMGTTGATRYGTAIRKTADHAREELSTAEVGAFSYSTISETVRTSQAAAVSLTGIASYSGGTEAISGDGTTYSGTMDLQVRFSANTVSGVISDLLSAEGRPWQHNFADVDRVVLSNARLRRDSTFTGSGADGAVFYTADSGLLRAEPNPSQQFPGHSAGHGRGRGHPGERRVGVELSGEHELPDGRLRRDARRGRDPAAAGGRLRGHVEHEADDYGDASEQYPHRDDRGRQADGEGAEIRLDPRRRHHRELRRARERPRHT